MPRSVALDVPGGELRVWRTSDDQLHAKLNALRPHGEHDIQVEARWDISPTADPWAALAGRARDGDQEAADELSDAMFTEAAREVAS